MNKIETEALTPMSPKRTLAGGYKAVRNSDYISRNVLKFVEEDIAKHEQLNQVGFEDISNNHQYTKQTIAGTNYKFSLPSGHDFLVWHKLDGSYKLTHVNGKQVE